MSRSTRRKKAKKATTGLPPGICRHCGCTEDAGCDVGMGDSCHWVDRARTICSGCENQPIPVEAFAAELWGIWAEFAPDGSQIDQWMIDEADTGRGEFPLVFFDRSDAIDYVAGQHRDGWKVRVLSLRTCPIPQSKGGRT